MLRSTLQKAAFTVTLATVAPLYGGPAAAQTSSSPIHVSSCTVLQAVRAPRPFFWYPWAVSPNAPWTDGLKISYVNTSHLTADRVLFLVNYRGDKERVIDAGTFSPNVTINHEFGQFTGDAYLGPRPNTCRVGVVRFSNGTVWQMPELKRLGKTF
jgi:hypothetical protein